MGRDENTDIKFWSPKVSRELIELITGPNIGNTQPPSSSSSSSSIGSDKTLLIIRICSRAKTIINGKTYKLLSKDSKPEEIDFTNEFKLKIETIPQIDKQTGQIITQDTPLFIEWIPFKLYISANEKCDQNHYKTIIKDHGIDIQIVDNIMDATHYYYDSDNNDIKEEEQKDEFKLAIIKGIPILNSQWLQKVLGHDNEDGYNSVKDWLLDIDYKKYLPKKDDHYLPKSDRLKPLNNVKLVSLERINWLETIIIDFKVLIQQQEDVLKSKIGDNQFILIVPTTMATTLNRHNFQTITEDQLWQSIKKGSILDLPKNYLNQLKRTSTTMLASDDKSVTTQTPEVAAPSGRKRRKYEKVDRLHFFSLGTTTPTTTTTPAPSTRDPSPKVSILDTDNKSTSPELNSQKINTSGDNDSITQEITQLSDPIKKNSTIKQNQKVLNSHTQSRKINQDDALNSLGDSNLSSPTNQLARKSKPDSNSQKSGSKSGSNSPSINNKEEGQDDEEITQIGSKRKNKDETTNDDQKPFKIPKFTPKVSLVDAVLKVQELNKSSNLDLESEFEINENLQNLAIVEIVDLVNPRNRRNKNKSVDDDTESRYAGRKNFKKFKKNKKLSSNNNNNNRRRIGLYTVEDNSNEDEDDEDEEQNDTTRDENHYKGYF